MSEYFMRNILFVILIIGLLGQVTSVMARETGASLAQSKGCNDCHGVNGISQNPKVPNLAGQKFNYLRKQINLFQSSGTRVIEDEKISERHHMLMGTEARNVTKLDMAHIVRYYSKLECGVPPVKHTTRIIPQAKRCEVCHGGVRTSPFAATPKLAGQKQVYLLNQMKKMVIATQNPENKNYRYHRLMELMVEGLKKGDMEKIAKYYADMGCEAENNGEQ